MGLLQALDGYIKTEGDGAEPHGRVEHGDILFLNAAFKQCPNGTAHDDGDSIDDNSVREYILWLIDCDGCFFRLRG